MFRRFDVRILGLTLLGALSACDSGVPEQEAILPTETERFDVIGPKRHRVR